MTDQKPMTLREKIARDIEHHQYAPAADVYIVADRILALIQADNVIVPQSPTQEMIAAAFNTPAWLAENRKMQKWTLGPESTAAIWQALLAAAPKVQP